VAKHIVRVIAAIVDDRQLTLYKEDGSTISILQGDDRLAEIIQIITPILAEGPGSVAEITLGEDDEAELPQTNPYKEFEQQTKGKVSFFKVAKSRLAGWLTKAAVALVAEEEIAPAPFVPVQTLGYLPAPKKPVTDVVNHKIIELVVQAAAPVPPLVLDPGHVMPTKAAVLLSAAAEIIKHAQPVTHADFHDKDIGATDSENTIVAVVGNKVIGGVEKLKPQFTRAVKASDSKGMTAFMHRVTNVADRRRHSADDLLKFLERGDLPIADDGSIVIYKVLRRKDGEKGIYVDCHTCKVTQRVGSYVCMDEKLVDPSRHNECSNGLHVARRAYVGGFSGDVCVLAKVRPEDVIAVPNHDANKMRVCGYHILFELTDDAFRKLKSNQAFTDTEEAQLLLGRVLVGDHDDPIEEVRITKGNGNGIIITPWIKLKAPATEIEASVPLELPAAEEAPDPFEGNEEAQLDDEEASGIEEDENADGEFEDMAPVSDLMDVAFPLESVNPRGQEVFIEDLNFAADTPIPADANKLPAAVLGAEAVAEAPVAEASVKEPSWKKNFAKKKAEALPDPVAPKVKPPKPLAPKVDPKAVVKSVIAAKAKVESRSAKAKRLHDLVRDAGVGGGQPKDLLDHKKMTKLGWEALGLPANTGEVLQNMLTKNMVK